MHTIIHLILMSILEVQRDYLLKSSAVLMKPYTQAQLAQELRLSKSVICRTIAMKSIETPWGEEKPIKDFFPTRKALVKLWMEQLFNGDTLPKGLTDEALRKWVKEKYSINLSRRSVNDYRRELDQPNSYKTK